HRATFNQAVASGQPYLSQFRIIRPDNGRLVWIEERAIPVHNEKGELVQLTGIVLDITERKWSEQSLRQAHDESKRTAERLSRLYDVSNALATRLYPAEAAEVIARASQATLQASASAVYLVSEDGEWLNLAAALGWSDMARS